MDEHVKKQTSPEWGSPMAIFRWCLLGAVLWVCAIASVVWAVGKVL